LKKAEPTLKNKLLSGLKKKLKEHKFVNAKDTFRRLELSNHFLPRVNVILDSIIWFKSTNYCVVIKFDDEPIIGCLPTVE